MIFIRRFGLAATLCVALGGAAIAQTATPPGGGDPAQIEFVQQADGMSYADGKLTLMNPAELTLFFAVHPQRFTGQMTNAEYAKYWADGEGAFASDKPNAVVMVANVENPPAVVELTSFTINSGGDFVYEIKILEGEVPAYGEAVALFIDPVGEIADDASASTPADAACHDSANYPHATCRVP